MTRVDTVPQRADIQKAWNHKIYDSKSKEVSVDSLFANGTNGVSRVLVVFIRHFFCGNCQEYIRSLVATFPPSSLPPTLRIAIIGCGSPTLIDSYRNVTGLPEEYPVYADPSTTLYKVLGMQRSLSLGSRNPGYIHHSIAAMAFRSILQGLKRIPEGDVMAAGGWSVNGGEYIFERDVDSTTEPAWYVPWCHKMQNSRDHTELQDLKCRLLPNVDIPTGETTQAVIGEDEVIVNEKADISTSPSKGFRRSMSVRRQSWMQKAGQLGRSSSLLRRSEVSAS